MILHVIPSAINKSQYGAGNWKAVEANRLALQKLGYPCREVAFDPKDPNSLIAQVTPDVRHVFFEYSWWPDVLISIKRKHPHVKIHVRTHNAEAYQYFHRAKIETLLDYLRPSLWLKLLQIAWRDMRCRRVADSLLGISEWDNKYYWNFLPGKAAIHYLPYYSPWPYVRVDVDPRPGSLRKPTIISMGGNFDPSGMANVKNFDMLATKLSGLMNERWSYCLTWWSQWHQRVPDVSGHIELVRECDEPWDLLCGARALAVLTPLGFGFKTTIVDGLAAGCHVIIHPKLANRLPPKIVQLCLVCDPSRDKDIAITADALSRSPENHGLNSQLSKECVDIFRSIFD